MKVLVIGNGGREHALCWALARSPQLRELYCAPGNAGIAAVADLVPIAPEEIQQLADFAADLKIDLTVVGPELPLSLGIVDEFQARGLAIFGPSQRAAQLESSKVFAKEFMQRHGIPAAPSEVAHDAHEARQAALAFGLPVVLKAEGLASGKGVFIVTTEDELEAALQVLFEERRFGAASDRVLVEAFLEGEEASFIGVSDGKHLLPMATSKDYKRVGDGDVGPNTGGMGAHSPSVVLGGDQAAEVVEKVMRPVVEGMAAEGSPFAGVLYAGLILTADGPRVLEFNVRFGDPEAQALLLRLEDDLLTVLSQAAAGSFRLARLSFRKEASVCLVMASAGYPGKPVKGDVIHGLDQAAAQEGVYLFHAGTARRGQDFVTAGGRVLNVCATGAQLVDALKRAYDASKLIHWPGRQLRRDIGRRVLEGVRRMP